MLQHLCVLLPACIRVHKQVGGGGIKEWMLVGVVSGECLEE